MQPISQTTYDLNSKLLVRYSSHVFNNKLLIRYSSHDLNNEPFKEQSVLDHLNTKLVHYSDPHCSLFSIRSCVSLKLGSPNVPLAGAPPCSEATKKVKGEITEHYFYQTLSINLTF